MAGPPKPKLRWFQFSLRSLMLFVTACAIACSWLAVTIQSQRRQGAAAKAIEEAGGSVKSERTWLGKLLRDQSLVRVTYVDLSGKATTDAVLVHLQRLRQLQALWLTATRVTDAGLVNLQGLSQLNLLGLGYTQITDAGLVHLQGLSQLQYLVLSGTKITDAGLMNLKELSQLKRLSLDNTKVTDHGVRKLQQALPNCKIER